MRAALWTIALAAAALLAGCSTPAGPGAGAASSGAGCSAPALGATTLYLRGTMNQWQPDEAAEFRWACNAYVLNVQLDGTHRFKIADDSWSAASIFGGTPGRGGDGLPPVLATGPTTADLQARFAGQPQTLRLALDGGSARLQVLPGHVDAARPQPLTDPVALSLRHDSRNITDKTPFGAVPAGTTVQFALTAMPGVESATLVVERRRLEGDQTRLDYTPLARIPMQRSPGATAGTERFTASHRFDDISVHGYWFAVRIGGRDYVLQNNRDAIHWTRERGSNGLASVDWQPPAERRIRRLRLSVYQPGFRTPDWAADAVYYYVFPERFRNGDRSNDPQPGSRRYQTHAIELHPRWTDVPFKPGSGDGSDAAFNNDFFGGDLAGLIEKLDHIRALGANALYMTPVFQAASNHKYDTGDFHRIDPGFGSNADFTRLTQEAAKRGIRVVVDTSLNHTGSDSPYFDRYGNFATGADGRPNIGAFANGRIRPDSPWAAWYRFDPTQTDPNRQYTGWAGTPDLPELDKTSPAWRDFAYRAPDSVTRRWLQAGAAGWRMDVAPWVPDDFWREWRSVVKQTDPQAITIAETWWDASKHLLGDMFDSTMNYIFRNAVLDYAAGGPASASLRHLELVREQYPPPAFHALMNLLSTHDQPRALHRFGDTRIGGPMVDAATVARAKRRLELAVLLQMAYPGAPAIYYGDEVGLTGGDDPYNRAPFPWADQGGQPDEALHAQFRRMTAMRQAHPVLRRGTLLAPLALDTPDEAVVVLARHLGEGSHGGPQATWAITAFNNAETPRTVRVQLPDGAPAGAWAAAWGDGPATAQDGRMTLTLPPLGGRVLVRQP
jgi:cyclomaltodextrinase